MAVSGQAHLVTTGLVFQLVSQFGECGKNVMGDWMMKSHLKLGALTYTMFLSPMHGRTTSCRSGDGNEFWRRFESCWQRMASRSLQVMRGVSSEKRAPLDAAVADADVDASLVVAIELDVNSDESVTQTFLCIHSGWYRDERRCCYLWSGSP